MPHKTNKPGHQIETVAFDNDDETHHPIVATATDLPSLIDLKNGWVEPEDGEITYRDIEMWFTMNERVIKWMHYSGQRWKDPRKLSKNTPRAVLQRWYVFVAQMKHWVLGDKTRHVDLARLLGVGKSMIMRSVKDWNVEFGIYGSNQKRVSVHAPHLGADGTYVEAGRRGHKTRRERQAAQPNSEPPRAPRECGALERVLTRDTPRAVIRENIADENEKITDENAKESIVSCVRKRVGATASGGAHQRRTFKKTQRPGRVAQD